MKQHLSLCDQASNSDRMEADSMQISNAASTSSQPAVASPRKITSFVDRVKITAAQQLRFSTLLCVAAAGLSEQWRILSSLISY